MCLIDVYCFLPSWYIVLLLSFIFIFFFFLLISTVGVVVLSTRICVLIPRTVTDELFIFHSVLSDIAHAFWDSLLRFIHFHNCYIFLSASGQADIAIFSHYDCALSLVTFFYFKINLSDIVEPFHLGKEVALCMVYIFLFFLFSSYLCLWI